jgi:uncharacterized membrane protein
MAFMDDLALVEVLIGFVAVLLCYVGLLSWWYIRSNNAKQLKETLRASSIPIGVVGAVTLSLGLWTEMTWPYGLTFLGGYNIFFGDAMVLFGLVTVAFAAAAYMGHHLHMVGLLAAVAGVVLAFYGWTGYTAAKGGFTKDPLDTFLMYGAFGLAAAFAFPATIIMDYYLAAVAAGRSIWQTTLTPARSGFRAINAVRATGSIAGVPDSTSSEGGELHYRAPLIVQTLMLVFPVLWALAAVAAFWYFDTTLPGHLGGGAGAAP